MAVKYVSYKKWPEDPKFIDYLSYIPLNIVHYFKNLSNAFGWKFVTIVGSVYGIQQGNTSPSSFSFSSFSSSYLLIIFSRFWL